MDKEIANIKSQFNGDENAFKEQLKQAGQPRRNSANSSRVSRRAQWIESQIADQVKIDDADIEKFYKENIKEFEQPEQVRASHILFMVPEARPTAKCRRRKPRPRPPTSARRRAMDFTKLAKELTVEPNAKGARRRSRFLLEGADGARVRREGVQHEGRDISEPVKTQFGFHVIKVTDKKAAGTVPFEPGQAPAHELSQRPEAAGRRRRQVIEKLRGDGEDSEQSSRDEAAAAPVATPDVPRGHAHDKTAQ